MSETMPVSGGERVPGIEGGGKKDFRSVSQEALLKLLDDLDEGKIDRKKFDEATGAINRARNAGSNEDALEILRDAVIDGFISSDAFKEMEVSLGLEPVPAGSQTPPATAVRPGGLSDDDEFQKIWDRAYRGEGVGPAGAEPAEEYPAEPAGSPAQPEELRPRRVLSREELDALLSRMVGETRPRPEPGAVEPPNVDSSEGRPLSPTEQRVFDTQEEWRRAAGEEQASARPEEREAVAEEFSREAADAIASNDDAVQAAVDGAAPNLPPEERGRFAQELQSESGKKKLTEKIMSGLSRLRSWEFVAGVGVGAAGGAARTAAKAAIISAFGSTLGAGIVAGAVVGSAAGALGGALTGGVREYIKERRKITPESIMKRLQGAMSEDERAAILVKAEEAYKKGRVVGTEEEVRILAEDLRAARTLALAALESGEEGPRSINYRILAILQIANISRRDISLTDRREAKELIRKTNFEHKKVDRQKVTRAIVRGAAVGAVGGMIGGALAHYVSDYFHGAGEAVEAKAQAASQATVAARVAAHQEFLNKKAEAAATATRRVLTKAQLDIFDEKFKAVVEKGDGATHVARKIAHDYVVNQRKLAPGSFGDLSKEQMVYLEDTLQRQIAKMGTVAKHGFQIGDEFMLSGEDIANAVDKAAKLDPAKLKNLAELLAQPEHTLSQETVEKITEFRTVFDVDNSFASDAIDRAREAASRAAAQVVEVLPPAPVAGEHAARGAAKAADRILRIGTITAFLGTSSALAYRLATKKKREIAAARAHLERGGRHAESVLTSLGYGVPEPKPSIIKRLFGRSRKPKPSLRVDPEHLTRRVSRISDALDTPPTIPMPAEPVVPQRMPRDAEGPNPSSETARRERSAQEEFDVMFDTIRSKGVRVEKSPEFAYQDIMECARRIKRVIDIVGTAQLQEKLFDIGELGTEYSQFTQTFYVEPTRSEQEIRALVEETLSTLPPVEPPPASTPSGGRDYGAGMYDPFASEGSTPPAVPRAGEEGLGVPANNTPPTGVEAPATEERTVQSAFGSLVGREKKKGILVSVRDDAERAAVLAIFPAIERIMKEAGEAEMRHTMINFFKPNFGESSRMFRGGDKKQKGVTYKVLNINVDAPIGSINQFIEENIGKAE